MPESDGRLGEGIARDAAEVRTWPAWAQPFRPDRVSPRECIRAARDALNKAYSHPGVTEAHHAVPFIAEAVDWQRRALEQMADECERPPLSGQRDSGLFERRGPNICISVEWPSGRREWVSFWPWVLTKRFVKVGDRPLRGDEFQEAIQYATVG